MMARSHVFVVPVCLDATTEAAADVPDPFKRVQGTRLPGGDTPLAFRSALVVARATDNESVASDCVSGSSRRGVNILIAINTSECRLGLG
jgi:hypothetical protein